MSLLINEHFFSNMFNISASFVCFRKIQKFLEKFFPFKIAENFTCSVHAILSVILCFGYLISGSKILVNHILKISVGFFLSDFFVNFFSIKLTKFNFIIMFHHLLTIFLLNFSSFSPVFLVLSLMIAELSNIPNYIVLHLIKTNVNPDTIQYFKKIQVYFYSFFRIIVGFIPLYAYRNSFDLNIQTFIAFFVYIFGVYWSYRLYSKYNKSLT